MHRSHLFYTKTPVQNFLKLGNFQKIYIPVLKNVNLLKIILPILITVGISELIILLRGNCTPNQKLTCFVLYLKIINTFLKTNESYSKLSRKLKNSIEIQVGQAVLELLIKTIL